MPSTRNLTNDTHSLHAKGHAIYTASLIEARSSDRSENMVHESEAKLGLGFIG